ncbi:MAG: permease-like cell division protein FtsX [Bacilli bacterium]
MKPFRIISRNIKDAFSSVFRNFSLSMASISCISITLVLVAISVILSYNVNSFTTDIEKDVTIVVFLKEEIKEEEIPVLETSIKALNNISEVKFKSKDKVKEEMKKKSELFKNVMTEYTSESNPLLHTYLVKVKDTSSIGTTADAIKKLPGVSLVKYGEGMVEELVKIFDIVKKITFAVVIGLILVTAFLISNTIKITIANRKREIEIMRLVGATNTYIKIPFFFEGIILGFLGSIIPIFMCAYGYVFLYDKLGGKLFTSVIRLVNPANIILDLIVIILVVGVAVGAFGSFRAVRKYLKI